jgi:hypothetical protein
MGGGHRQLFLAAPEHGQRHDRNERYDAESAHGGGDATRQGSGVDFNEDQAEGRTDHGTDLLARAGGCLDMTRSLADTSGRWMGQEGGSTSTHPSRAAVAGAPGLPGHQKARSRVERVRP